jgi:TldD protein
MKSFAMDNIREVVSRASRKAGYADLYLQTGASHSILFEDGRMDTLSSSEMDGLGARIIKGENTVYSHRTGTSASVAAAALTEALGNAGMDAPGRPIDGGSEPLLETAVKVPSPDVSFFRALDRKLRSECSFLRQVTLRLRTSVKSVLIVKGDGSLASDTREYTTFAVHVALEKDGALETGYEVRSLSSGLDDFWRGGDAEKIARKALERGLLMLDAAPCPAGNMMVLMDGTAGGTMIHEACGHGLEADIIQKDFSSFRDRIGEQVANPLVTLIDDAAKPGMYGSFKFDDEGTPARKTVLIEDGVLKSYMTDILSAQIGDLPLTGNGRRESYQHQPMPRMSNTFVAPGKSGFSEMLDGVGGGLLVKKMGGGEVNPTSGDFVFYVSEGYLIEKGKIGRAVKGATLTGNGPEALMNIVAVGRDLVLDPGTCGKSAQSVPVTDGQPTILISNLTVGGSDTGDDL